VPWNAWWTMAIDPGLDDDDGEAVCDVVGLLDMKSEVKIRTRWRESACVSLYRMACPARLALPSFLPMALLAKTGFRAETRYLALHDADCQKYWHACFASRPLK
jgi:hypothetical protein